MDNIVLFGPPEIRKLAHIGFCIVKEKLASWFTDKLAVKILINNAKANNNVLINHYWKMLMLLIIIAKEVIDWYFKK